MSLQVGTSPIRKRRQKKIAVFELLNSHAKREYCEIDKSKLKVPISDYQRDESEGHIANEIAMHFDTVAFGVLLVIQRTDGELVVADGGTRLAGARLRKDITLVPCIVFSGLTDKEEGDVFLRVNCNRRKLQTDQQHHAELFSDHDLAVRSQMLLDKLNHSRIGFESLSTMRNSVRMHSAAIGTIVNILIQIAADKHVTARVMKGLVRLEVTLNKSDRTLDKRSTIKRMQEKFSSFDAVVNAMVRPRTIGSTVEMARALARTLHIQLPKESQS
jgi:hypothetical protein